MNILLIDHHAGSLRHGMEFRPFFLAREWVRRKNNVTIIAATFSHVRSINPIWKKNGEAEEIHGIRYIWLKTPAYSGNNLLRILNILAFIFRLYKYIPKLIKEGTIDAVIASSTYPLDIFPARRIARKAAAKLVYEVHDLWPLTPIELRGYSRRHPYIVVLQAAEDYAYKHADIVASLLLNAKEYMISRGMNPAKFLYVPNFISEDYLWASRAPAVLSEMAIAADKFVVGYLGALGLYNSIENLIGAAEILKNMDRIVFILVGDGPERARLEKLAVSRKLNNLIFVGRIEKTQVPAALSRFDLCYIGFLDKPIYRMGISPNKLFDYMAAAKPIILAANTSKDLVQEAKSGITIEPENPKELAKAILRIMALPEVERLRMGGNGRRFALDNHTCRIIASGFLEALKK